MPAETNAVADRRATPLDGAAWSMLAHQLSDRSLSVILCVVGAVCQSAAPAALIPLARLVFDRAIPRGDVSMLVEIGLGLAAIRLLGAAMIVWTRARVVNLKTEVVADLRRELLARLYARSTLAHARAETQPLLMRIVADTDRVDALLDALLGALLPAALTGLALTIAMAILDPPLVAATLVAAPLVLLVGRRTARRMHANYQSFHQAHDTFVRTVRFALDNFGLTRVRGAETVEMARQSDVIESLRTTMRRAAVDSMRGLQVQTLMVMGVGVAILVGGGVAVIHHATSLGGLLAFMVAAGLTSGQVDRLIGALPPIVEGASALSRLHTELAAEAAPIYRGARALAWSGAVALEKVDFSYGAETVLRSVSLRLEAGSSAGLIGANGAGKTTIINLILGLHRPDRGRLIADGEPFDGLDLRALRRRMGLVEQHPLFFSGSVFDNVAYGAGEVTRREAGEIAESIGAGQVLAALPGGLDAPLGEGGLLLSGGQRQMVAILRAMMMRPRLLLLDEPTNHLDREAVTRVLAALRSLPDRPSVLLISHDMAATEGLDALYRLEAGHLQALRLSRAAPSPDGRMF